jgi:glycosyltransferase involved in cell wall biosynthesis
VSDHEGFGVTLLEAMHHEVPVVAYASTAVPETVGDGGLLLETKQPTLVAAAVHRVVTDRTVRDALVASGKRRLADFELGTSRQKLRDAIESVVS